MNISPLETKPHLIIGRDGHGWQAGDIVVMYGALHRLHAQNGGDHRLGFEAFTPEQEEKFFGMARRWVCAEEECFNHAGGKFICDECTKKSSEAYFDNEMI